MLGKTRATSDGVKDREGVKATTSTILTLTPLAHATQVIIDMEFGVFLYREGVLRLSSSIYDPDNLDNTFSHLTNHCIQTASPYYESLVQGNEMFFDQVRARWRAARGCHRA